MYFPLLGSSVDRDPYHAMTKGSLSTELRDRGSDSQKITYLGLNLRLSTELCYPLKYTIFFALLSYKLTILQSVYIKKKSGIHMKQFPSQGNQRVAHLRHPQAKEWLHELSDGNHYGAWPSKQDRRRSECGLIIWFPFIPHCTQLTQFC